MQENRIIEMLRNHEQQGMEELLCHYGPLMKYIIAPILPEKRDQEECLSEVAMRVWEKIDQYESGKGKWTSWLTALTRNTALNFGRDSKLKIESEELKEEIPSNAPLPEEIVIRKEKQSRILSEVNQLSMKEQELFYRKYYYLQPISQIARELGFSERAVEGRLYRLKKKLQKCLGGELHD